MADQQPVIRIQMFHSSELVAMRRAENERWLRAQQQARHEESLRQLRDDMPSRLPPPSPAFGRRELGPQNPSLRAPTSQDRDRLFEEGRLVPQIPQQSMLHPTVGSVTRRFEPQLPDRLIMSPEMMRYSDRVSGLDTLETRRLAEFHELEARRQTQINELAAHRQLHVIARQREAESQRSFVAMTAAQERLDNLHFGNNDEIQALRRHRQNETAALRRQAEIDRNTER